jgi:formylmethanofuran dehydrogenase subunit C
LKEWALSSLVLQLRATPDQRLDLSPLVAHRLEGKTEREIAAIELQTTRQRVTVGDVFALSIGRLDHIVIRGGSDRLDRVGEGIVASTIVVEGDVGNLAGRGMGQRGQLIILGSAGHWTGSGMAGGDLEVRGNVGDRLAGPLPGEMLGMSGGILVVRGAAGERAGDRLRRGTILVEGTAAFAAGSRMRAGTLIVRGSTGPGVGYLMHRGTIVLGSLSEGLGPTFLDCGTHDLVACRLMAQFVRGKSAGTAEFLMRPLRRFAGDTAVLGKGEILMATAG